MSGTGILPDAHRCTGCSFVTASADRMDGHMEATGHTPESFPCAVPGARLCRCEWLGVGTPEHVASALCISLRPDADRDPGPDPCANGCTNPAMHAEGGHDV